ncbi:MAG: hypothetical protein E7653_03670 [Ruminococcaceae bacterium]|nr:hypothetical protein [Oscillospiraceae bacterium]
MGALDIGITYFLSILLLIICFIAYVFLVGSVFPKLILRPKWGNGVTRDRGVKRYKFKGGRAVVYEPDPKVRKYVMQYILSENSGKKYVKCKVDPRVSTIKYDVVVYDAKSNAIDNIHVEEAIATKGYTRAAELPEKTSYVSLVVREINYHEIDKSPFASYSLAQVITFASCNVLSTVLLSLVLRGAINNTLDTFFDMSMDGIGFCIITSTIFGLMSSGLIFLCNYSKGVRITRK